MNKHIRTFVFAVGLFMAGIIGISKAEDVSAKTTKLTVVPTQYHYTLNPGETKVETFKFSNDSDYAVKYSVAASPYFIDNDGDKSKVSYNKVGSYNMITDWVTFDIEEGTLDSGEHVMITFTIKVPTDVPAGGQYFVPMVTTSVENNDNSDAISIGEAASIGPVVYAVVNGETREDATIDSNEISGFLFNPPIQASSKVTNNGNVHAEATYILRVYPFFGGESIYNTEENPHKEVVFPGTSRYYNQTWEEAPAIGIYKVQSEVKIFDEVSTIERIVIICPMWVLILIIVFILAVIFWIVARVRARKQS